MNARKNGEVSEMQLQTLTLDTVSLSLNQTTATLWSMCFAMKAKRRKNASKDRDIASQRSESMESGKFDKSTNL